MQVFPSTYYRVVEMTGAVGAAPSLASSQPLVPDEILTTSSV